MKLLQKQPSALIPASYNPSIRTNKKELSPLLISIKANGILYPIMVDKNMNIIDGHRRLACANQLKLREVPVIVSDTTLNKDECYETINSSQRKMNPNEMIFVYVHGGRVPKKAETKIIQLEKILGLSELKKLSKKYVSVSILSYGLRISDYCNNPSIEFKKKAILWLVRHKQTYRVRRALEDGINASRLKRAITEDRALKYEWN
jgi:ParB/RepB/Spo0J family partition protein